MPIDNLLYILATIPVINFGISLYALWTFLDFLWQELVFRVDDIWFRLTGRELIKCDDEDATK
jgi:hypothetical protein